MPERCAAGIGRDRVVLGAGGIHLRNQQTAPCIQIRPQLPQIALQRQQAAALVGAPHRVNSRDEVTKPAEQFLIAVGVDHVPGYLMLEISVSNILLTAVITCDADE